MLLLCATAAAAPIDLGTSLAGGVDAQVQAGRISPRPRIDLLDLEIHIGERLQIVPRIGRLAAGLGALQILDAEVDLLARFGDTSPGWQPFVAVGVGPKLTVGAAETVLGAALVGRVGYAWSPTEGRRRVHLFAEPVLTLEGSRSVTAFSAGVRAGAALTWRL